MSLHDIIVRLSLSIVCGGILGFERGRKQRPAGLRTYMLVCIASTLVMMTNEYICETFGTGDPTRMGAQVISGIGFLGAGTIVFTGQNKVKGLTTAAGLWSSACIGLAIGVGFYAGALFGGLMIYVVMSVLHRIEEYLLKKAKMISLYVHLEGASSVNNLIRKFKEMNVQISSLEFTSPDSIQNNQVGMLVTLKLKEKQLHDLVIQDIVLEEGIISVEEI